MPHLSPVSCLFALFALFALTAQAVLAQTATPPPAPPTSVSGVGSAQAAPVALPYRSVFDGYQPFTDAKVQPWKDSNLTVEKIGGWRAYAKEVAEPEPKDSQAPTASPAAPAAPAATANPHAGHGKH